MAKKGTKLQWGEFVQTVGGSEASRLPTGPAAKTGAAYDDFPSGGRRGGRGGDEGGWGGRGGGGFRDREGPPRSRADEGNWKREPVDYSSERPRHEDRPRHDDRGPSRYEDRGRFDRQDDRGPPRGDRDFEGRGHERGMDSTPGNWRGAGGMRDEPPPAPASERPRLNLKPRTAPKDGSEGSAQSGLFGGAKPVDTRAREAEVLARKMGSMRVGGAPREGSPVPEGDAPASEPTGEPAPAQSPVSRGDDEGAQQQHGSNGPAPAEPGEATEEGGRSHEQQQQHPQGGAREAGPTGAAPRTGGGWRSKTLAAQQSGSDEGYGPPRGAGYREEGRGFERRDHERRDFDRRDNDRPREYERRDRGGYDRPGGDYGRGEGGFRDRRAGSFGDRGGDRPYGDRDRGGDRFGGDKDRYGDRDRGFGGGDRDRGYGDRGGRASSFADRDARPGPYGERGVDRGDRGGWSAPVDRRGNPDERRRPSMEERPGAEDTPPRTGLRGQPVAETTMEAPTQGAVKEQKSPVDERKRKKEEEAKKRAAEEEERRRAKEEAVRKAKEEAEAAAAALASSKQVASELVATGKVGDDLLALVKEKGDAIRGAALLEAVLQAQPDDAAIAGFAWLSKKAYGLALQSLLVDNPAEQKKAVYAVQRVCDAKGYPRVADGALILVLFRKLQETIIDDGAFLEWREDEREEGNKRKALVQATEWLTWLEQADDDDDDEDDDDDIPQLGNI